MNLRTEDLPPERQAREAILEKIGSAPDEVCLDGEKIHRFKVEGDKGADKSGWYIFFGNGLPAGAFGNWRTGETHTWHAYRTEPMTDEDSAAIEEKYRRAREARDNEAKARHALAAETCKEIWADAPEATDEHPYLQRKQVKSYGLRVTGDGRLIMPIYVGSELTSLQYIDGDGKKQFHSGGEVSGGYFRIPANNHPASATRYIVEGYATAASVHEATGCEVWVALNAGNMGKVGRFLRDHMPDEEIVFVGDNDVSGVGQKAATDAAEAIKARTIIPPDPGDANDYAVSGKDLKALLVKKPKPWLIPLKEFCAVPEPIEWLIDGWIQEEAQMMVFGASKAGKTFIILDMALSIACPGITDWHGFAVKHAPVVYLAGEGQKGLKKRCVGWMSQKGISDGEIYFHDAPFPIDGEGNDNVANAIREIMALHVAPKLIIIDTLNKFQEGDENKAQDTARMIRACEKLREAFRCTIAIIHHTGLSQDSANRSRGSSAWRGAMDIELQVEKNGETASCLRQTKTKDSEPQDDLFFDWLSVPVPGWINRHGKQETTIVIRRAETEAGNVKSKELLTVQEKLALKTYLDAASKDGILDSQEQFAGLREKAWRKVFYSQATADGVEAKKKAFQRVRNSLQAKSLLAKRDDVYRLVGSLADNEIGLALMLKKARGN